jgi:formate dehydrogenase-N alpha subunit
MCLTLKDYLKARAVTIKRAKSRDLDLTQKKGVLLLVCGAKSYLNTRTTMDVSRRQFFKICAGGMAGTTAAMLGFAPKMALAQARNYKLLRAKEIRNTCTYCSVGCGLLMYSLGDGAKNAREAIYHIEGDPDHPVSRGALCPKGAGLLDYVHSENRLRYPEYRAPGSDKWQRISWDEAFSRIAKLMKADRDANFVEKNAEG